METWHSVSVINLKFSSVVFIVANSSRQEIEELSDEPEILSGHVWDLEYRTYPVEGEGENIHIHAINMTAVCSGESRPSSTL